MRLQHRMRTGLSSAFWQLSRWRGAVRTFPNITHAPALALEAFKAGAIHGAWVPCGSNRLRQEVRRHGA